MGNNNGPQYAWPRGRRPAQPALAGGKDEGVLNAQTQFAQTRKRRSHNSSFTVGKTYKYTLEKNGVMLSHIDTTGWRQRHYQYIQYKTHQH